MRRDLHRHRRGAIVKDGRYLMVVRGEGEYALGGLSFPGGKVEGASGAANVLEETLRLEIAEEVGLDVHAEMANLRSSNFVAVGVPVVDVVLLCRRRSGEAAAADPAEVAAVRWMQVAEAMAHPEAPPCTHLAFELAERARIDRGWQVADPVSCPLVTYPLAPPP